MRLQKSHNIWLGINNKPSKANEEIRLTIFYKYGGENKMRKRSTDVYIPANAWDKKTKDLTRKAKGLKNLKSQVAEVSRMQEAIRSCMIEMNKGLLTIISAFDIIEGKNADGIIDKWLENTAKIKVNAKGIYRDYQNGIYKQLRNAGRDDLIPLKFSHLQDKQAIESIAKILIESTTLGNGTIDYMHWLDSVTKLNELALQDPFKKGNFVPRKIESATKVVTKKDLLNSFNKINTKQDFMALNFFLLQLCLRGLDGQDVANLNEKMLVGSNGSNPYHPDAMLDPLWTGSLSDKAWVGLKRGKQAVNQDFYILFNLFPTYFLHDSLKRLIKETHPKYAYKGKDRLRLFSFKPKDDDWNTNSEDNFKWKDFRGTISKKLVRMVGAGVKSARHSFVAPMNQMMRLSDSEQAEQIGHKTKKRAIKFYQTESQLKTDLIHIGVIEELDLLRVIDLFYLVGKKRGYIDYELSTGAKKLFEKRRLASFGIEEELELQKLTKRWEDDPEVAIDEDGIVHYTATSKPKELIELESRKRALYELKNPIEDLDMSKVDLTEDVFSFVKYKPIINRGARNYEELKEINPHLNWKD